jgi:hypothetical protein
MTINIQSMLVHEPEPGDGIRAFIVSSRTGVLASTVIHQAKQQPAVAGIAVEAGETLDFLVDIREQLNSDQFLWSIELREAVPSKDAGANGGSPDTTPLPSPSAVTWSSTADFPKAPNPELTPLQQLAQILLCSNEFLFVD